MRKNTWTRLGWLGLWLASACGDDGAGATGDDPSSSSSSGTVDSSSSSSESGSSSSSEGGSSSTGGTADASTTSQLAESSSSESESSTTESVEEDPTCEELDCPANGQWCMQTKSVEDTDGGEYVGRMCVDLPAECVGLAGDELTTCLEPLCCESWKCPQLLDEAAMEFECFEDPSATCGVCPSSDR